MGVSATSAGSRSRRTGGQDHGGVGRGLVFVLVSCWRSCSSVLCVDDHQLAQVVWRDPFLHPPPQEPGVGELSAIFTDVPFARFLYNTMVVSVLTLGAVVSSIVVGYSFARFRWPARDVFSPFAWPP